MIRLIGVLVKYILGKIWHSVITAGMFVGVVGTAAEATLVSADEKSAENARRARTRLVLNLMVPPR